MTSEVKATSDKLQFAETKIQPLSKKMQLDETNLTAIKVSVRHALIQMTRDSANRERALQQQIGVLQAAALAANPEAASGPIF